MVDYRTFEVWTAEHVATHADGRVVLELKRSDSVVGRYTVAQGGEIEPEPADRASRELLLEQATTIRRAL